jgi:hypothetical protein
MDKPVGGSALFLGLLLACVSGMSMADRAQLRPDGQVAQVRPDGRGAQVRPEGRGTQARPDGRGAQVRPDGRGTQARPDGRGAQARPDGRGTQVRPIRPGRPGGHDRRDRRTHLGVGVVVNPFWYDPWYYPRSYYNSPYYYPYYPYYSPYYYPPAVVTVPASPPVYIEREDDSAAAPGTSAYWYYCTDPEGYYPYVRACPGGWQAVAPQPADEER